MNAIPDLKDRVDNAPLWSPGSRKAARPTRIIRSISVKNLMGAPRASYLVKGVFPDKGVAAIYGPSASGKTFLTLDVALAVARGTPWFEHRVKQAGVIYIAAEGESGISDRLRAALGSETGDVALEVIPAPVDLLRGEDHVNALIAAIHAAEKRIGRVGLVVLDTLARCMPSGDENSSQDMGSFLQNIDRLRRAIDGLVLIVHHTGKDQSAGARGHSSFFSAMDGCVQVSRDGDRRWFKVAKSREGVDGNEFAFRLATIELGEDEDGDMSTSCVVESEDRAAGSDRSGRLASGSKIGLDTLREVIGSKGQSMGGSSSIPRGVCAVEEEDWRRQFYIRYGSDDDTAATKSRAFRRAKQDLIAKCLVMMSAPFVWMVSK